MTTEQPDGTAPSATHPGPRPLRRRASDRVLGGVASGIADYFNIDPLVIRAAFVGLMIFGGSGLVLYVGAWLLIPAEGQNESPAASALRRRGAWVVLGIVAFLLFLGMMASEPVVEPIRPGAWVAHFAEAWVVVLFVAVVVLGVVLLRGGGSPGGPRSGVDGGETATAADAPAAHDRRAAIPRTPPKPRGPLGLLTLGAALIAVGTAALVDTASPGLSWSLAQLLGLALGIIGLGLVIGAWMGNARLLILPALVILPMAWMTSYIRVPIEGGWGDVWVSAAEPSLLEDEYRLIGGHLTLDLTEVPERTDPIHITASVAMGEISVWVPPNADLEISTRVGAGGSYLLTEFQRGTDLVGGLSRDGTGPEFVLDLATGLGSIQVEFVAFESQGDPYPVEDCAGLNEAECEEVYGRTDPYPIDLLRESAP